MNKDEIRKAFQDIRSKFSAQQLKKFNTPKVSIKLDGLKSDMLEKSNISKITFDKEQTKTTLQLEKSFLISVIEKETETQKGLFVEIAVQDGFYYEFNQFLNSFVKEHESVVLESL